MSNENNIGEIIKGQAWSPAPTPQQILKIDNNLPDIDGCGCLFIHFLRLQLLGWFWVLVFPANDNHHQ